MLDHRHTSKLIGLVFIASFIAYGSGSAMVENLINHSQGLSATVSQTNTLVTGVLLITLVHGSLIIGLCSLLLPILKRANTPLAYTYFAMAITSQLILSLSALSYLLLMPLTLAAIGADLNLTTSIALMVELIKQFNSNAYQVAMAFWAMGGMAFASILWRWQLAPKLFGVMGIIGYMIFFIGTISQLWGYPVGLITSIPGGLFEIALSIWLIIKGINTQHLKEDDTK